MRLLLDSHIYLWALIDDPKLTGPMRKLMTSADEVFVSAATVWELSIKIALGNLDANASDVLAGIEGLGARELPVSALHAVQVRHLPALHKDPFDRLLVGQAIYEQMHFLTHDTLLRGYSPLVTVV
jgi:PIN domain nuclease of toxin-antitoxin system